MPVSRPGLARTMDRLRDLIDARCAESIPLAELAAAAGLSRFRFAHAFKRVTGVPPHAYQIRSRIGRARVLLGSGARIAAVAVDLGFADQAHFTRHFKRIVGLTPGAYAQRAAGSRSMRQIEG